MALAASLAAPAAAQTDAAAADTVASQIREQGHPCEGPTSAKRGSISSDPDGAVWILTCKNASYRVQLVPDMAAKVERID